LAGGAWRKVAAPRAERSIFDGLLRDFAEWAMLAGRVLFCRKLWPDRNFDLEICCVERGVHSVAMMATMPVITGTTAQGAGGSGEKTIEDRSRIGD
jgi:hypothetical protein